MLRFDVLNNFVQVLLGHGYDIFLLFYFAMRSKFQILKDIAFVHFPDYYRLFQIRNSLEIVVLGIVIIELILL